MTPARKQVTRLLIRCTPETSQLGSVLLAAATQGGKLRQLPSKTEKHTIGPVLLAAATQGKELGPLLSETVKHTIGPVSLAAATQGGKLGQLPSETLKHTNGPVLLAAATRGKELGPLLSETVKHTIGPVLLAAATLRGVGMTSLYKRTGNVCRNTAFDRGDVKLQEQFYKIARVTEGSDRMGLCY